jgi:hypothetical protein
MLEENSTTTSGKVKVVKIVSDKKVIITMANKAPAGKEKKKPAAKKK